MSTFTSESGAPLVNDDGKPIDCDICPCPPDNTVCCPDQAIQPVWVWPMFMACGNPFPLTVGTCVPVLAPAQDLYNAFSWAAGPALKITWNSPIAETETIGIDTLESCIKLRAVTRCIDEQVGFALSVKLGPPNTIFATAGWHSEGSGLSCPVPNGCAFGAFSSGLADHDPYMRYFYTTRDPATGLVNEFDGTVAAYRYLFTITIDDVLYSCELRFSPLVNLSEFQGPFHLTNHDLYFCYNWFGYYNQGGLIVRVMLDWDEGGNTWTLLRGQPFAAFVDVLYSAVPFPPESVSNWTLVPLALDAP